MADEVACWMVNEDGHWCPSCGDLIARPEELESGAHLPDECCLCGYPDTDAVADYHLGPDDDFNDDDDGWDDCALGPDGQCGKAGSEECDWYCGRLR